MNRVLVVFSDELLAQVDAARGLASRSAWIRSWCEHGVRVENEWPAVEEAVAPLVPEHGDYALCNCGHPETLHRKKGTFAPCQIALCECQQFSWPPVPEELKEKVLEAVRQQAEPKPKARRKKVDAVLTQRGIQPSDIQIPVRCHCKRGMIIGAGPRKGQCTVCGNPKPLEAAK